MKCRSVILTVIIAVALPLAAWAQSDDLPADPYERLAELERRIAQAKDDQAALLPQIEEADGRRAALDALVVDLEQQHAVLDQQLEAAKAALRETEQDLAEAESSAADARHRLERIRQRARVRMVALYKGGHGALLEAVLGSQDLVEADARLDYMRAIVQSDRALADLIKVAGDDYADLARDLDRVRVEQDRKLRQVEGAQRRVSENLDAQRRAVEAVEADAAFKRSVLAEAESNQAAWEALLEQERRDILRVTLLLSGSSGIAPENVIPGLFTPPLAGPVTSGFGFRVHPIFGDGRFHAGIDISASHGTPIHAAAEGTVVDAGWMGGYGNAVVIDHGGGLATLYAHASELAVGSGQFVQRGETIAYVGSTGYSTGPHLHFEVRAGGEPTDPLPWLGL